MMGRCGGAKSLRAMQGAFAGDTPAKIVALYSEISKGRMNQGLDYACAQNESLLRRGAL